MKTKVDALVIGLGIGTVLAVILTLRVASSQIAIQVAEGHLIAAPYTTPNGVKRWQIIRGKENVQAYLDALETP